MKQKGVALILVLWVLSILTLMAGSFTKTMRRESTGVMTIRANAEANAQAQAGISLAQAMLLHEDEAKRWRVDGSIYEIETENATMRIRLLSETGKIDINSVTASLLHQVLLHAPLETQAQLELENAILDWRDDDETTRPFGAEKPEYKAAKLSYSPRNKPFRALEELQMVRGLSADVFAWMQPIFTVYAAGQTEVDLNLATRDVLNVLPEVDVNLLDTYFLAHQQAILNHSPMPVVPRIENAAQAMTQDVETTTEAEVSPDISTVTVTVEAILDNDAQAAVQVVMEKIDGANNLPFQILTQQNQIETPSLFSETMNSFVVARYVESNQIR
ncbi:MAG: type II secretion system protein GspK [Methylococcales bacterium]|nr:type II secretion system protein GspK [Methylococcales bacterium]